MSFLRRLFGSDINYMEDAPAEPERDPSNNFWFQSIQLGRRASNKVHVTVDRARRVPVVRDCIDTLAGTISTLPGVVFERVGERQTAPAPRNAVSILLRKPNAYMTSTAFIRVLIDHLATEGNFFAEKVFDRRGAVKELHPIEPRHCTIEHLPGRDWRLSVTEPYMPPRTLLPEEVFHIAVPPIRDYVEGTSPITEGAEAIGAAIALQEYASAFFTNDATPPYAVTSPNTFKTAKDRTNFISALRSWLTGSRRHMPAVLDNGFDIKRIGVTNEEAQFLETRKELWHDIARLWRMPPHKVGLMDRATFSNIEHQGLEFVTDTLMPWLELVEAAIDDDLLGDPKFYFEFNVAHLLRGDIKARFEAYALARQWGFISVNEIRHELSMNPIGPDGDRFIEPLNMTTPGGQEAARRDREQAITFLRESVRKPPRRPRLELVHNAA